jgi:hypothetical protein
MWGRRRASFEQENTVHNVWYKLYCTGSVHAVAYSYHFHFCPCAYVKFVLLTQFHAIFLAFSSSAHVFNFCSFQSRMHITFIVPVAKCCYAELTLSMGRGQYTAVSIRNSSIRFQPSKCVLF